ncbi:hypothetical protein YD25_003902 [Salmonella enterica subsp. enterica]|nr:hypothetical protein [Salmonella enterica subsp. enterica serovar Newport]EDU8805013.1 hypothetical protein [Salmonella enterica subsp. enterica]
MSIIPKSDSNPRRAHTLRTGCCRAFSLSGTTLMQKVTTAASYSLSVSSFLAGLLDHYTQAQWNKAAMLAGIVLGVATFFLNWYYRRKTLRQLRDMGWDEARASKINHYLGK